MQNAEMDASLPKTELRWLWMEILVWMVETAKVKRPVFKVTSCVWMQYKYWTVIKCKVSVFLVYTWCQEAFVHFFHFGNCWLRVSASLKKYDFWFLKNYYLLHWKTSKNTEKKLSAAWSESTVKVIYMLYWLGAEILKP